MLGTPITGCGNARQTQTDTAPANSTEASSRPTDSQSVSSGTTQDSTSGQLKDDYNSAAYDAYISDSAACTESKESCIDGSRYEYVDNSLILPYYPDFSVPEWNTESYDKPDENGYCLVQTQPLSTFAADVDTASYSNIRRMIENGCSLSDIPADAVRPEEFINYFSYDLNKPGRGEKFGITTELSSCPWNDGHSLLFVGMTTQDLDLREAPDNNLVFLIDVSGSMSDENNLPLLQKSFDELIDALPENGTVSIVTYASGETVVLSGESMKNKQDIKDAIDGLAAGGATNGEQGIQKAYEIAEKYFIKGGNNRVIMATDGDLNVGISDPDELEDFISEKKKNGVFLSVLGFGMGNYKDDRLERLADCGNGNYSYIDSFFEAKKVLVDEMGSNLVTVAKDVKLQVEFNPLYVNGYRLIGYENRVMDATDFNDDTKDGGEIGAGHSVVALYEIIPSGSRDALTLRYQTGSVTPDKTAEKSEYDDEMALVKVRSKEPESDKSGLEEHAVIYADTVLDEASDSMKFAGLVAEFAMILGRSEHLGNGSLEDVMDGCKDLIGNDEYRNEFASLVRMIAKRER
ncbi:MAG: von Willebrand factor type A domain-containing protein [Lachnospiraceae bacterium]|nr:von Willebrand factor type A domain-containing protein [Lachnospiraceae bacterium]